jgi:uncharacterized protein (TIGR02246 family)
MRKLTFIAGCLLFASGYTSLTQTTTGRSSDVQAIKKVEEQWNKDFETKNIDALVGHYTNDASFVGGGGPAVQGIEAIRTAYKELLADPNLSVHFRARRVEVSKSGDLAFTEGSYEMTVTDPNTKQPVHDKGNYLTTFKKQPDGSWKAVSDYASSEMPPGSSK